jgi:hypothetical protein
MHPHYIANNLLRAHIIISIQKTTINFTNTHFDVVGNYLFFQYILILRTNEQNTKIKAKEKELVGM